MKTVDVFVVIMSDRRVLRQCRDDSSIEKQTQTTVGAILSEDYQSGTRMPRTLLRTKTPRPQSPLLTIRSARERESVQM